jgi:hypothetical protein
MPRRDSRRGVLKNRTASVLWTLVGPHLPRLCVLQPGFLSPLWSVTRLIAVATILSSRHDAARPAHLLLASRHASIPDRFGRTPARSS